MVYVIEAPAGKFTGSQTSPVPLPALPEAPPLSTLVHFVERAKPEPAVLTMMPLTAVVPLFAIKIVYVVADWGAVVTDMSTGVPVSVPSVVSVAVAVLLAGWVSWTDDATFAVAVFV